MFQQEPDPRLNRLLAVLPNDTWQRLRPHLEPVHLHMGQVLCEAGGGVDYVYFPITAIVSLLLLTENGATAEVGVVGNEGMVGISLVMGGANTPSRAIVQCAGQAFRIKGEIFKKEFHHSQPLMHLMLRYIQALITHIAQTAVCNRHHCLDQQLCGWLLYNLDRLPGNELLMTQELIANTLGVRREGVTEAALKLQKQGLISYARGHISVLDRAGLERRACECYSVVKREYDRLLPDRVAV